MYKMTPTKAITIMEKELRRAARNKDLKKDGDEIIAAIEFIKSSVNQGEKMATEYVCYRFNIDAIPFGGLYYRDKETGNFYTIKSGDKVFIVDHDKESKKLIADLKIIWAKWGE